MNLRKTFAITIMIILAAATGFSMSAKPPAETNEKKDIGEKPKVTFIELGSKKCIPCRMMQKVMDEVEKDYGSKVKVVFYDVWTDEGRPFGERYKIKLIPTQIFFDENGVEYLRHEGFYPKEEVDKVLQQGGARK